MGSCDWSALSWDVTNRFHRCVCVCFPGVRCWPVDLEVPVLDQQLKLFVSRHSAFLSEDVPGKTTDVSLCVSAGQRSANFLSEDFHIRSRVI